MKPIVGKQMSSTHSENSPKTASRRAAGRLPTPAPELDPLDAESGEPIGRQVYLLLRRSMMSGGMLPGARISARSIANALGVSSMPVREALARLESEGAVASLAKSAFIVNYPTVKEFDEILRIRLQLEMMLAEEATPLISDADVERVAWLQDRMAQSRGYAKVLSYNYKLHFLIYRAADMPYALALVENVWVKIGPLLHAIYSDAATTAALFDHHNTIVEGLKKRDSAMVVHAVRADLTDAAAAITRTLAVRSQQ